MKRVLTFCLIAFLVVACAKQVWRTDYVVYPLIINGEGEAKDTTVMSNSSAYVFYADTALWRIASYDNAVRGVITNKETGETKTYDLTGSFDEEKSVLKFTIDKGPIMMVVCNEELPMYAYKKLDIAANLAQIVFTVYFDVNKSSQTYESTGSKWTMVNGATVPEEPEEEEEEN